MREILERAPRGRALDVACGTGRYAQHLGGLGYEVVGVDRTKATLDVARAKVPGASFRVGDMHALPVDDASFDVAVCALALSHVPDLGPVLADIARVVKPGGWVVLSDMHPLALHLGIAAFFPADTEGLELHYVVDLIHEPRMPETGITGNPAYAAVPDAVRQAFEDLPFIIVWRLVRRS